MVPPQPHLNPAGWVFTGTRSEHSIPLHAAQPHGSPSLCPRPAQPTQPGRLRCLQAEGGHFQVPLALPQSTWWGTCMNQPCTLAPSLEGGPQQLPALLPCPAILAQQQLPFLTSRQRAALLIVHPSRSASRHPKGTEACGLLC